jgi:hypothetical protein
MVTAHSNVSQESLLGPIDTFLGGEKSFKRDLDESKILIKRDGNNVLTLTYNFWAATFACTVGAPN